MYMCACVCVLCVCVCVCVCVLKGGMCVEAAFMGAEAPSRRRHVTRIIPDATNSGAPTAPFQSSLCGAPPAPNTPSPCSHLPTKATPPARGGHLRGPQHRQHAPPPPDPCMQPPKAHAPPPNPLRLPLGKPINRPDGPCGSRSPCRPGRARARWHRPAGVGGARAGRSVSGGGGKGALLGGVFSGGQSSAEAEATRVEMGGSRCQRACLELRHPETTLTVRDASHWCSNLPLPHPILFLLCGCLAPAKNLQ
jgi:hypothetical protein